MVEAPVFPKALLLLNYKEAELSRMAFSGYGIIGGFRTMDQVHCVKGDNIGQL